MPGHSEIRVLPHTPEQMFDLVADVARYPDFLPWCLGARVRPKGDVLFAELTIGFKMIRERYTSKVVLDRANGVIDVTYLEGPFRYLTNRWRFRPVPDGVEVDFLVDFEFRSPLLQAVIGTWFDDAVHRMVRAFETRARELYSGNIG